MDTLGVLFALISGVLLLVLPRRWAVVPLLMRAACMTRGQVLELGPFHFPMVRILIGVGFVRIILRGERIGGDVTSLDRILIIWAICLVCTSVFHTSDAWVFRLGIIWTDLGSYLLFRVFVRDMDDIRHVLKNICVLLVPVAVRSEEHTSELQSPCNLVCRLLL